MSNTERVRMGDAVFATAQGREVTGWVQYIREDGVLEIRLDEPQVFEDRPVWNQTVPFGVAIRVLYTHPAEVRLDPSRPNRAQPVPKKAQP